jgi:hypothetical protein
VQDVADGNIAATSQQYPLMADLGVQAIVDFVRKEDRSQRRPGKLQYRVTLIAKEPVAGVDARSSCRLANAWG